MNNSSDTEKTPSSTPSSDAMIRRRWILFITISVAAWVLAIGLTLYFRKP
ncbi:MAG: hypothetical protein IKW38_06990 [Kiritimatiellae bacterium]|nr:hypothetical protein [Kiritimatiellia bacterium]